MSSENRIKVLISSKQLSVYNINDSKEEGIGKEKVFESKLEKNNLSEILQQYNSQNQTDAVDLLFTDDIVITGIVKDESGLVANRDEIANLTKTKLSLDLDKKVWDFTKINDYYQVVCLPDDFSGYIAPAFAQAGIKINSIEPVSVSLAKLLSGQSEPTILVYDNCERMVAVCWQGLVFEPTIFIPVELSNKAKKLKINYKSLFGKEVNQAVVSADFADPYVADLTGLSLETKVMSIDPFSGIEVVVPMAGKDDVTVKEPPLSVIETEKADKKNLVTTPSSSETTEDFEDIWQENPKKETESEQLRKTDNKDEVDHIVDQVNRAPIQNIVITEKDQVKTKRVIIWLAIIVPLIITFVVASYVLLIKQTGNTLLNPLVETSVQDSDEIATQSGNIITDKKAIKIQVLNGSGITGEAAKVKGLLEKAGFIVNSVGNATTSGIIKTEIKSNLALSDNLKRDFQDTLSDLYDLQYVVGSVSGFDISVIVGKSK